MTRCYSCGQDIEFDDGAWRNHFGYPTCPKSDLYPFDHTPESE